MSDQERREERIVGILRRRLQDGRREGYSGELLMRVFMSSGGIMRVRSEFAKEEPLKEEAEGK